MFNIFEIMYIKGLKSVFENTLIVCKFIEIPLKDITKIIPIIFENKSILHWLKILQPQVISIMPDTIHFEYSFEIPVILYIKFDIFENIPHISNVHIITENKTINPPIIIIVSDDEYMLFFKISPTV